MEGTACSAPSLLMPGSSSPAGACSNPRPSGQHRCLGPAWHNFAGASLSPPHTHHPIPPGTEIEPESWRRWKPYPLQHLDETQGLLQPAPAQPGEQPALRGEDGAAVRRGAGRAGRSPRARGAGGRSGLPGREGAGSGGRGEAGLLPAAGAPCRPPRPSGRWARTCGRRGGAERRGAERRLLPPARSGAERREGARARPTGLSPRGRVTWSRPRGGGRPPAPLLCSALLCPARPGAARGRCARRWALRGGARGRGCARVWRANILKCACVSGSRTLGCVHTCGSRILKLCVRAHLCVSRILTCVSE